MPKESFMNVGGASTPLGNLTAKGGSFAALASYPAWLLLRTGGGINRLSWSNIGVVTLAMLGLNWLDNVHLSVFTLLGGGVAYSDHTAVRNFGLGCALLAGIERFKRLDEEKRGVQPHRFSPGVSRFGLAELLPWSPKVIAVAVEPGLAFLAGAVARRLGFSMLGWVILGSAVCFAISEWRLYDRCKEEIREEHDLGLEAQWKADLMKDGAERRAWRGGGEASGLATGIDGLDSSIGKRFGTSESESAGGAL